MACFLESADCLVSKILLIDFKFLCYDVHLFTIDPRGISCIFEVIDHQRLTHGFN